MPLYDFLCLDCHKRFEIRIPYQNYGAETIHCPSCQSTHVKRRIGRIRVAHSEEAQLEAFADPSALAGMENDPKAMGKMLRKIKNEIGEETPPEFDDVVDRLEKGQSPDEISNDLPDISSPMDESSSLPDGDLPD